jgi:hypothetical protein
VDIHIESWECLRGGVQLQFFYSSLALTILDSQTDYISAPTFALRIQTRRCPAPNRPGNERLDMPTALLRRLWSPTRTLPATSPSMTLFCTTRSTTTLALCTLATCTGLLSSSTIFWAPRRTEIDPLSSTVSLTREVSLYRFDSGFFSNGLANGFKPR